VALFIQFKTNPHAWFALKHLVYMLFCLLSSAFAEFCFVTCLPSCSPFEMFTLSVCSMFHDVSRAYIRQKGLLPHEVFHSAVTAVNTIIFCIHITNYRYILKGSDDGV
jgi:hypothetical protein